MTAPALTAPRPRLAGPAALGPAFVAAVAYVDPGNVATNTSAGAAHGFRLLWVVVLATVMAGPVQYSAAKLGLVTGQSLPRLVANRSRRGPRIAYWAQAEAVAVATDVAEVVGAAVGLHLLFGLPLLVGGVLAGAVSLGVLVARDRHGARFLERFSVGSLLLVAVGFAVGLALAPPRPADLVAGLVPRLGGADTVLLAAGIVGATVMPHAVYLHSALTAERATSSAGGSADRTLRAMRWDVGLAMVAAGGINVAMLVLGTAVRGAQGSLGAAAGALADRAGSAAAVAFAVALTVSGLASTAVGTQAGSVIMSGLLRRRVPGLARRLVALVPALLLLASGHDPLHVLVLSQVCLAVGLPFALVPLLRCCADRALVGVDVHRRGTTGILGAIVGVVVLLDLALVALTVRGAA
ncbi:Nramp family divalent metal transporter [Angustibacter sp. Root456]|uniref:Nramp family divalent metal transporter n=1 Tax=Angustibacter sp. Root456 TaxID=1736539 RepID=UPI0007013B54|nr:Nramp family divalent metal transporter [Angustibacter sp. Root456]KQX69933.1 manganese transporter [Angustibacter sp. Root456]